MHFFNKPPWLYYQASETHKYTLFSHEVYSTHSNSCWDKRYLKYDYIKLTLHPHYTVKYSYNEWKSNNFSWFVNFQSQTN